MTRFCLPVLSCAGTGSDVQSAGIMSGQWGSLGVFTLPDLKLKKGTARIVSGGGGGFTLPDLKLKKGSLQGSCQASGSGGGGGGLRDIHTT